MTAANRALIRLEIKEQLGAWLLNHASQKVAAVVALAEDPAGKSPAVTFMAGGSERPELAADGSGTLAASIQVFVRVRVDAHDDPELVLDTIEAEVSEWVEGHREGANYHGLTWDGRSEVEPQVAEDGTPWLWERIPLLAQGW